MAYPPSSLVSQVQEMIGDVTYKLHKGLQRRLKVLVLAAENMVVEHIHDLHIHSVDSVVHGCYDDCHHLHHCSFVASRC